MPATVVALLRRRERQSPAFVDSEGKKMTAKTLLMALGVGMVVGFILGISLVGLIGGNREGEAPPVPPARTVTVEEPAPPPEKTVPEPEKSVPATSATATATATATASP
jgi:hypothetical protein